MITKLCASCGKIIPFGRSRCDACEAMRTGRHKDYDTHARNKKHQSFYNSNQWKQLRDIKMVEAGYQCQACRAHGIVVPAEEVHHIVPIDVEWDKRMDPSNLVCLCHKHHMEAHVKLNKTNTRGL